MFFFYSSCCNLFISDIFTQFASKFSYLCVAVVCFQLRSFSLLYGTLLTQFFFSTLKKNANEKTNFRLHQTHKNLTFIKVTFLQSYFHVNWLGLASVHHKAMGFVHFASTKLTPTQKWLIKFGNFVEKQTIVSAEFHFSCALN